MLEVARRRMEREGLTNVELAVMDCEHTSFPAHSFDHVVIPYVYSVTPDPHQLIREARRVCKPGGDIFVQSVERCLVAPSATMTQPGWVGAMFQAGSGSSAGVVSDSGCENACTWAQVVALV